MKHDLLIAHYAGAPWAILPEKFEVLARVVKARALHADLSFETLPSAREEPKPERRPGVALLELHGTIFNRGFMASESGLTTPQAFEGAMRAATADKDVEEIVLSVDSPGGVALNIDEMAAAVRAAAKVKRVTSVVNGYGASAAYWAIAPSSEIVATPLSSVGSIGVIASHADYSRYFENEGVDLETYRTGSRKALGQRTDPNDETFRESIQAELEDTLRVFAADVASGRRMSGADVLERYALDSDHQDALRGGTVLGADAVRLGLADRMAGLNQVLGEALSRHPQASRKRTTFAMKGREASVNKLQALLASGEEVTPEQIEAAAKEDREAALKQHAEATAKTTREAEAARVAQALGVEAADDDTLGRLKAQAAEGAAYREALLNRVHKASIALEGNDPAGIAAADRMKKAYSGLELGDIKAQAEALEAKVASSIPGKRISNDGQTSSALPKRDARNA